MYINWLRELDFVEKPAQNVLILNEFTQLVP